MEILVLGRGAFGRAVGSLLAHNKVPFEYADIDAPVAKAPDLVFVTVPVAHIREALTAAKDFISSDTTFVNCAKGIEAGTLLLPHQIIDELFSPAHYFSFIGPSFASEIVESQPTLVNLGYRNKKKSDEILKMLQTPYFRAEPAPEYQYLELSAAMKNVYAIASGYLTGVGYAINARTRLIMEASREIAALAASLQYPQPPHALPGDIGDLFLTCSSEESRNFKFGELLSELSPEDALTKAGATVEGYNTSKSIAELTRRQKVELPLATLVATLIEKGKDAKEDLQNSWKRF